uniref:Uncharacterized protein n=1 Tax=Myoviridae sp. ctJ2i1 TaxID=2825079 RepID=A0A8S5V1N6_9CAUD|nr:MAG TPA: hypothetical protein [Myoviridae sp. ctJ2i1]
MNTYLTALSIAVFLTELLNRLFFHFETIYTILYCFIIVTLFYITLLVYFKYRK